MGGGGEGGGLLNDESWIYNGRNLEVVNNFDYLGTVFNYTGNFALNQETLVGKGLKAKNYLLHNTKDILLILKLSVSCLMPLWALFLATLVRYGVLENVRKSKEFILNFISIY